MAHSFPAPHHRRPQLLILCSPSRLPLPKHPAKVSFPGPLCLSGAMKCEQERQLKADRVSHTLSSFPEPPLEATHSHGGVRGWKGSESLGHRLEARLPG